MPWNDDEDDRRKGGTRDRWDLGETRKNDVETEKKKTDDLLGRAEPMIEQVNTLYGHYISGLEQRPPNELRKHLETIMSQLMAVKGSSAERFRISSLNTRFTTFRERWDRLMRDLESGKITRAVKEK